MSAKNNLILYHAKGVRYINQTWYSIASLINVYKGKVPKHINVMVYTDDVSAFDGVRAVFNNIECILLTDETSKEWAGEANYIFRFKPKLIEDALNRYNGDANALYLDTDTAFIRKVDSLFESLARGNYILHIREWILSYGMKQWGIMVVPEARSVKMFNGQSISINDDTYMWNAGVVGIPGKNSSMVKEVISVLDILIADGPHYLSEQLTWSVMLSQNNILKDAEYQIYHYWANKDVLDKHIADNIEKYGRDFGQFLPSANPFEFLEPKFRLKLRRVKKIVSGFLRK